MRNRLDDHKPLVKLVDLPHQNAPDSEKRREFYKSARWQKLRFKILKDNKWCLFCGSKSKVGEHVLGHGDDALQVFVVLSELGIVMGEFERSWEERFWRGPFCGSCRECAASRSGRERHGDLVGWTREWIARR